MQVTAAADERADALRRAEAHAPFLRAAIAAFPDIVETFLAEGSEAAVARALAVGGATVGEELRRRRHALALATALADLSGEGSLDWVTATLSDFADAAMDQALRAAMLERVPDEDLPSWRWASLAAASSTIPPTST